MSDITTSQFLFAFGLTLFAGLSTGVGSLIALYIKKPSKAVLSASLGFSAGVMIYVSFVEIFVKANESLSAELGSDKGHLVTVIAFFAGIAIIALIDFLVPDGTNPHHGQGIDDLEDKDEKESQSSKALLRMGMFSAIAIAIHNFPEGLATFVSALEDPAMGISIAIAIAIHNIPEGIAVAVPIYFATKNRGKAFKWSFISGLSEPLGALIGFFLLSVFFNELTFGIVFALVAGIMVYISIDELLPTAEKHGKHHVVIGGLVAGMIVMAVSLVVF